MQTFHQNYSMFFKNIKSIGKQLFLVTLSLISERTTKHINLCLFPRILDDNVFSDIYETKYLQLCMPLYSFIFKVMSPRY